MEDYKLVFDDATTAITTDRVTTVLDLGSITEAGEGTPVFIEVWLDTAFSSATETLTVHLVSKASTDPAKTDVLMTVLPATAVSGLGTPGLLAKVPLPSEGLDSHVALAYVATAALASGKIKAFLSIP